MDLKISNINFKELLDNINLESEDVCLISKEKLNSTQIKLLCGHSFNYLPLYKEVFSQKTEFNPLSSILLKKNQIQCPYCRNIQNSILPYKNLPGVKDFLGVTRPRRWQMLVDKCSYKFKSGKKKGESCGKSCNGKYCSSHVKYLEIKKPVPVNSIINSTVFKIKNKETNLYFDLEKLLVKDLKELGKQYKIKGYYKLKKNQLINSFKKIASLDFLIE